MPRPLALAVLAVLSIGLAATVAGCGSSDPRSAAPSAARVRSSLAGSPPALARLHGQAGALLGGGPRAFAERLQTLRDRPLVVNAWASWCGPCRAEFPLFQSAGVRFGRRVAFLGLNVMDSGGPARAFLARFPITYPSYADPDGAAARTVGATAGLPVTTFYDGSGGRYVHQGGYTTLRQLVRDIRRYALGS